MLAKQSWRILRHLDSLLAKTLIRGKYFKTGSFLQAKLGARPSYAWRSILWGRDLFKKGYRWKVGNGFSINLSSDPWLPRDGNFSPVFTPIHVRNFSVAWLMEGRGRWDEIKVRESFIVSEADIILQTPLPSQDKDDEIIWGMDKTGIFSVRSAYHLGIQLSVEMLKLLPQIQTLKLSVGRDFGKLMLPQKSESCAGK